MTKRDDDSQADMEVGMTTAERRRRRRRGGLRVPSDNVPRRSSTPPVVAPVPEDPGLAMSLAYGFTAGSSEPVPRSPRDSAPSFENHEGMSTVIDPVSDPVEQADFEMKTREMTAVDLEELGLSELAPGALPIGRATLRDLEPIAMPASADGEAGASQPEATDLADDVEVDLDASMDGVVDASMTLDPETSDGVAHRVPELDADIELDSAEPTAIHPGPPVPPPELAARPETSQPRLVPVVPAVPIAPMAPMANEGSEPRPVAPMSHEASGPRQVPIAPVAEAPYPRPVGNEASGPRPAVGAIPIPPVTSPAGGIRTGRAQTVVLGEDDLEEVREAARLGPLSSVPSAPVLPPSAHPPPSQSSGPPSYPSTHPPQLPTRPASTSIPPPMPPAKPTRPRTTAPLAVPAIPVIPTIEVRPVEDRTAEAPTEFEVDVDGIVDPKAAESAPVEVKPVEPALSMPPSIPPSIPPPAPPPRDSQPMAILRDASSILPPASPPRDSQPMAILREGYAAPPPPPVSKAPPAPPPAKKDRPPPAAVAPLAKPETRDQRDAKDGKPEVKPDGKPRGKPWFIDLFDEDYLRTLPFLTPQATQAEAEFVINALGLQPGAQVLDVGCGYGRHAMELAARGFHIVGLDLSTPLLVRGGEEAHRRGLTINFVRGDMRELDFDAQFDGAYCLFSTFGYFDDETNKKTIANLAHALRPGGRLLIEILNRDYVIADLPTRVWWEGDGCVVLEEVELNYFSSRIQVNRSVVFDDGRQLEQEISVRAYSLHEVGKLMHSAGLRVLEVSGAYHTRGRFFGNQSRHIIVLAERKDPSAT